LLAILTACSSPAPPSARDAADANDNGRTVDAKSDGERALLKNISALPSSVPRRMGDAVVVAEPFYDSASGRRCRAVHLTTQKTRSDRVACTDGRSWFFVPDVFGGPHVVE
jgi:hypothetical protein